ncbi:DUF6455 family protein [Thioclava atlantica]|nr:DUF6455 family protein [Thioclava atlantica]
MHAARNLNRHAAMLNRMAELVGADLTRAMVSGRLSGEAWKEALIRCTGCKEQKACMIWLAEHDGQAGAGIEPPQYCENRLTTCRLRDALQAEGEGRK